MYENNELENRPCPLGCTQGDTVILEGKDLLHGMDGNFTVVRCNQCRLMRTNPRPTPQSIGQYYPESYMPYKSTEIRRIDKSENVLKKFAKIIEFVLPKSNATEIPNIKEGALLEIGCASGRYMSKMKSIGWDVTGIEYSQDAANNARQHGLNVISGTLESISTVEKKYDLIAGWMVLEHLHQPVKSLRKLRDWIKPNGYLAMSVPNAASYEFLLFKKYWYALQLPTHLFHFTPETIEMLLSETGWKLEKIIYQNNNNNLINSVSNLLSEKTNPLFSNSYTAIMKRINKYGYWSLLTSLPLSMMKQTGRITFWATPK